MATAVGVSSARGRDGAILGCPSIHCATTITLTHAAISLVLVCGCAMTGAVLVRTTRRWNGTAFASPSCDAHTDTSVGAVQILSDAVSTAVFHCIAHWRNSAGLASPAISARAFATICLVEISGRSVVMTIRLRAWRWDVTRLTGPCIWSASVIALTAAAISGVHVCGLTMATAVLICTTSWGSATISSSPVIQALALASVSHVQVTGHTVSSAMDVRTARWWNGAIFAREHRRRPGGGCSHHNLAHALTSIGAVRIHSGAVPTAMHLRVARKRTRAIRTFVAIITDAFATIHPVQISCDSMVAAVHLSIARWRQ